jgi:hypothetical protein
MNKFVPVENNTVHTMSARFIACLIVVFSLSPAFGMSETCSASMRSADTILVQKQQSSKRHKVKLYPNANHEVLFFSARGVDGRVYQLFLFDIDGKLVKQVNIKNKQTTILEKIDKGNYLFEVFSDDERIENGQVIVR